MIATDKLLMQLSDLDALPGQEAQVQQALQETIQGPIKVVAQLHNDRNANCLFDVAENINMTLFK